MNTQPPKKVATPILRRFIFAGSFLFLLAISLFSFNFAHAQSASTLQAEQVATKNYLASPNCTNFNQLRSMQQMVSQAASAPGNQTVSNAQAIEQAANNAINNTPPTGSCGANAMNQTTSQQVAQQAAQTASVVAKGGSCSPPAGSTTDLPCASGLECDNNGICNPTPSSGSVAAGGWCGSNDSACMGGATCNNDGMCVAAPAAAASAPVTTPPAATFVPLTNLPILCGSVTNGTCSGVTSAPGLAAFLNALYKYCVGIAATLAVLQIMRAGIMYMGGDSVSEVSEARALISTAILGLLLVLSPVIVFSIIDPRIITLSLGSDFSALNSTPAAGTPATPTAPAATP